MEMMIYQGCDGGILLNDTANFTGEQGAPANSNSVRGFSVIDQAKRNAQTKCADTPISCADVLAIAARDAFRKVSLFLSLCASIC